MTVETTSSDDLANWVCQRIWAECDAVAIIGRGHDEATSIVTALAQGFIDDARASMSVDERARIVHHVVAATLGLGPIEPLLRDPHVTEVMVNGPHAVFVERNGILQSTDVRFDDDEHVRRVIDRILAPIGRRLDALSPMVDARLADGSRVNAVIPPLSVDGPTLTIRRFHGVARTLDDLERLLAFTAAQRRALQSLVANRANVLVVGPTSSGKTTLLAAVLEHADPTDRILVVEDAAELPLRRPHLVRLEARPETFEGHGEVRIRDLLRNALRMRPDRMVIGEVRGAEAFDLVQALNTGHRGCWSTVHAESSIDALLRLESMAMLAGVGVPHAVVRQQISRAFDAIVVVGRSQTRRCVMAIDRVTGLDANAQWLVDPLEERDA